MSDFDKEAEREKLRKKFARDKEKRADTQRMSELLLKGATMTNKHCDRCGDPLFRYNGQTFCPSCQADDSQSVDAEADAEGEAGTISETPAASDAAADPEARTNPNAAAEASTPAERSTPSPEASSLDGGSEKTGSEAYSVDRTGGSTDDLSAARQSLVRTLNRFARQAERTDNPRRARELLAAAHEAAATLAELD